MRSGIKRRLLMVLCLIVALTTSVIGYFAVARYQIEAKAKEMVRYGAIDPESVQFRNISILGSTVCGEFNSRNRMGGYGGFSPFLADVSKEKLYMLAEFESFNSADLFWEVVGDRCPSFDKDWI